ISQSADLGELVSRVTEDRRHSAAIVIRIDEGGSVDAIAPLPTDGERYRFPRCGSVRSRRLEPVLPRAGRRGRATRHRRFRWQTGSAGRRSRYSRVDGPLDSEYSAPHRPDENPCPDDLLAGFAPDSFATLGGSCGAAMELFTQLFGDVLAFVYRCFDRIVIYGYLSGLSRPEQVVHFFRNVVGVVTVSKEVLSHRTADYQAWVEAYARNHRLPIEWAEKGVRKEDHVLPWQRRMAKRGTYGVYFIFKSMEQGATFRVS